MASSVPKTNQVNSIPNGSQTGSSKVAVKKDPTTLQRLQLDSFNLRTATPKPVAKTASKAQISQKSSNQTTKMNPTSSSKNNIPPAQNTTKTPIQLDKVKAAISQSNNASLERTKPAVSNSQSQAKTSASKQINSSQPKTPTTSIKPKATTSQVTKSITPKTSTNSNALSSLPSVKQDIPSIKKESQAAKIPKKETTKPPVKKTPSSATIPKNPSTNSLPPVKKTPTTKPTVPAASKKEITPQANPNTASGSNQKKTPVNSNNNVDPNTQPTQSKPAPKAKQTPAMAALTRKMANKPSAGAIMKKPSASNINTLPSMKTVKTTAPATPAQTTTTAQKSPHPASIKRAPLTNKSARSNSLPKPMGGGAKRLYNQKSSHYSEVDDYDLDDDFIDNTEDSTAPTLDLSNYLKGLGFYKGPTSLQTYRNLDPHYDPSEMEVFDDDGDDCMEVNSFSHHIAMDAKTVKKAIEEDKREREEEKRQIREEANKRKRNSSTPAANTSKKKKTA